MSALKPSKGGKYRETWKIWGQQAVPSQAYKDNYDQIEWGKSDPKLKKEELTSSSHYIMKFVRE